ncbi:MAG: glyceraldehyde 3-phosphate dehydrogenase NAD-binding domain-containing protein, partial [Acidobacteriota bacterium]
MGIRVGINGFGRIGRSVLRILTNRDDMEVVAINDLFENEQLAYLLEYDTVMRTFNRKVRVDGDSMYVDDRKIVMTAHRDPAAIPWKKLKIDLVIESTGVFRQKEQIARHLQAG